MDQDLQIPQDIRAYLEGILQDGGVIVEDSAREEVIKELYARLDNYLASVILENLPEDQVDEFTNTASQKKDMKEMETYIVEKLPNAKEILKKAFLDFRSLYLGNVAVKREADNLSQRK